MSTSKFNILLIALTLLLGGCIKNDLPYPHIQANFTAFMVEGESEPAVIDPETRTITLTMGEEANLEAVKLLSYELSPEGSRVADDDLPPTLNLIRPLYVTVRLYEDFVWTIRANQNIERYITLEGQMGQPVIDVPGRRIVAYVPKGTDLSAIKVTSLKVGSTAATMEPNLVGQTVDFSRPVDFVVNDYGRESLWTIYVEPIDAAVTLNGVDAWTRVAWLYANAEAGKDNGFEYRIKGTEEWTKAPAEWITAANGQFTCRLIHLTPATVYEVRAYSGLDVTALQEFTTGEETQLPNNDFELWWLDGKVWNPWAEGGTPFWDTGNKGASTLGTSNSIPTEDTPSGVGFAAELKTEFKGIGSIGKIAAGNIFTGVYVRTDGTNGVLNFGREFSQRPTRLTLTMKYNCAPITHVGTDPEYADWKGRPDNAQIYIALTDWAAPFEVRTNPKNRQLFDPNAPEVIAYGSAIFDESVTDWTPVSIELDYRSTSRVPRYVLVVCSASRYGDFFVGGSGSVLTIDDLVLEYDY